MKKKLQYVAMVFGRKFTGHSENSVRQQVALHAGDQPLPSFSVTTERRA